MDAALDRASREAPSGRSRWRAARDAAGAAAGAFMGALPHVLHHVGLLAGAALVTGVAGNAALFVVGLLLSVPLLLRLRRRFRAWMAPAVAVAVFAGMFTLSALVIGPAVSGSRDVGGQVSGPASTQTPTPSSPSLGGHDGHHAGSVPTRTP
ncbi:MAG TPA: hypothetical protein VFJ22_12865 [Dermatophilaceae bacterium]|nr:hypothetical protein [Dermatophilaceae bacterium]